MAVRAKRIWAEGKDAEVMIVLSNEKMHASGRFANVFAATLIEPVMKPVAVKRAWESKEADKAGTAYKQESEVLSQLNHPNITRLLYYFVQKLENETCHWMILDFLPLDMGSLKIKGIQLDRVDQLLYSYQLWSAVDYIHTKGYLHLDIKPANIIVDHERGMLQLADFGNSKKFVDGEKHHPYQVTRFYRAPELLFGATQLGYGVDWWAAACVTAEFILGRTLLRERSADDQVLSIIDFYQSIIVPRFPMRMIVHIFGYPTEADIKKMKVSRPRVSKPKAPRGLKALLDKETPPELLPFLQSALVYSPDARLTPANALKHDLFKPLLTNPPPTRWNRTKALRPTASKSVELVLENNNVSDSSKSDKSDKKN